METYFLTWSMCCLPTVITSVTQAAQVNCILLSKETVWSMWGVYCPKHIYPLLTRIGFWSTIPRDKDIWNLIQKLRTVQCHVPLTSVYSTCTGNYVPCSARTLWYLCTTAVPETTVQCHDPLISLYNSCSRNYILYSARTLWHLCTTTVPETVDFTVPGPFDFCVQQLYQKL
jgi:hypothetical protein